ncbi:NUDIX hydrolase [Synechococcus elongatus]|uniref:Mutator MutT protein n=1 Tax=Synechococcus elongatus (strain ATCC 33912 / PCC 7942 / FACHB-805) TaxID=1140 RepID=Q31S99_SYNE7|nr:NUDIX hydrolase [Synechococcus elongatus]ABB56070.1 mutator MutT protein [Synechococcus elongatus PCC 7942 = FACHB-805]AJD56868.1 DNA mismatch repair protein MutT [Synechococcus elongatus UTEX 2973]MBD2587903.1 NUDIX hydrolase [Synechococcus elongatus FACHB-242]MBD2688971.1 NUDIX hydrolase [Synechococcus elongatus FACHB-1061]MBD2707389.1 NUDIX hydrolase [Synechococcus elongatus PCC 7942 = FACHB-805]
MLIQPAATTSTPEVALAIITQGQQWLLQLRDDLDWILYPGKWGLFGGHLEPDETPLAALYRELQEEIGYYPSAATPLWTETEERVTRYLFHVPLTCELSTLRLGEGQDFCLVDAAAIAQGRVFSPRLQQERAIGAPHQQILLRFQGEYSHKLAPVIRA